MNLRPATPADEATLHELWEEFFAEVPEPTGFELETWDEAWQELLKHREAAAVILAEDEQGAIGLLDASAPSAGRWHVETVYVRPRARRGGVATALLGEFAARARAAGVEHVSLSVLEGNAVARAVWQRLGFTPVELLLDQPLAALEARLSPAPAAAAHGAVHVQTDDRVSVERAVAQFLPRLQAPTLAAEVKGWIRIADPLLDDDREAQGSLAADLSERLGTVSLALGLEQGAVVRFRLYDRGRMVDEYLSVPTFYGELPKAEELALAANPTLVARLTGASFDEVRHVARTASTPGELPPAEELYGLVARMLGVEP